MFVRSVSLFLRPTVPPSAHMHPFVFPCTWLYVCLSTSSCVHLYVSLSVCLFCLPSLALPRVCLFARTRTLVCLSVCPPIRLHLDNSLLVCLSARKTVYINSYSPESALLCEQQDQCYSRNCFFPCLFSTNALLDGRGNCSRRKHMGSKTNTAIACTAGVIQER